MKKIELIVIGGSWGGMNAVVHIFSELTECCSVPIIIVLHRLKNTESELAELLSRKTHFRVEEIDEKEIIQKGKIYLAPADYHVLIESDHSFTLDFSDPVNFSRPSIDVVFESAVQVYRDKVAGILLTGANSDGARGLKKLSDVGGITIVQDPEEAEIDTMPKTALALFSPSYILKLNQIREFIKGV